MRYLPHTHEDRQAMQAVIGIDSVDDLFADVPQQARLTRPIDLPCGLGEMAVEQKIKGMAARNLVAADAPFFLGAGAYRHHIPATVDHLIQRSEFLTSYTPYQPEVSQGTLQYLFEFQTQVALLTGMEVANASMWDGSTGTAEAVLMACRITRRRKAILSGALHPQYRVVTQTVTGTLGIELDLRPPAHDGTEDLGVLDEDTACVVVQYPDFYGYIRSFSELAASCQDKGILLIVVVTEPLSLGLVQSPGAMGADIVVGEGQGIGVGLSFGGPYLGLFATRQKYVRHMPGRLVGQTSDVAGQTGYVLTLNTREQHIRREKATSNICTNSGLCCLAFTIHMSLLGEEGFCNLARLNHAQACQVADRLEALPQVSVLNTNFFNEFTVDLGRSAAPVVDALAQQGVLAGVPVSRLDPHADLDSLLLIAVTETTTDTHIDTLVSSLGGILS